MLRRLSITAALIAGVMCAPAQAAGDAAAGAQLLKELNLISLSDTALTSEVEGKAFIGGNLSGSGNFGVGNDANPGQGQATTGGHPILFVGGSITSNFNDIKVKNGKNYVGGFLSPDGSSAVIGGNSNAIELQHGTKSWTVGGNLTNAGNFSITNVEIGGNLTGGNLGGTSGGTIKLGGTNINGSNVNANGATVTKNLGLGYQTALQTTIADKVQTVTDNVNALSTLLSGMTVISPSSFSKVGSGLTLNAVDGGEGFALFNLNATDMAGLQQLYVNAASGLTVVVNVTGLTSYNWDMTVETANKHALNSQIIWNFVDTLTLGISDEFHGTILATKATTTANTQINGTLVTNVFKGNGEVHLSTYNGTTTFNAPPVPEPATWAMMIAGMGIVGASLRRRAGSQLKTA